jgi:hypothetical protein
MHHCALTRRRILENGDLVLTVELASRVKDLEPELRLTSNELASGLQGGYSWRRS